MRSNIKKLIWFSSFFSVFALVYFQGCKWDYSGKKKERPKELWAKEQSRELLELNFYIDPSEKRVELKSKPGKDAQEIGQITASLEEYEPAGANFVFLNNLSALVQAQGEKPAVVLIFLKLEGTNIKTDLMSVRVRITEFPSGVKARDIVFIGDDGKGGVGAINMIGGFDEAGLPYYEYGDFYETSRALVYEGNKPSSWLWALCFDFNGTEKPFEIKAEVQAELAEPDNENAKLSIAPYLTNITTSSVSVLWETDRESSSILYYGTTKDCPNKAEGEIARYQHYDRYLGNFPKRFTSFKHKVKLSGLSPSTVYYYQVRDVKEPSPVYSFRTLSALDKTFRFGVIGDTQVGDEHHRAIINQMLKFEMDFYIHLGDMADFCGPSLMKNFFAIESPLISHLAVFPVNGNHDHYGCIREYFDPAEMGKEKKDLLGTVYSFNYQGVYFIVLDTVDLSLADGSAQSLWLEQKLSDAYKDPARKFTFIFNHSPFYSGHNYFFGVSPEDLSRLGPLFRKYDVSGVFSGHIHLYERMDVSGKPYIISGGGGGELVFSPPDKSLIEEEEKHSAETISVKFYQGVYHFCIVEVGAGYFNITAYDEAGKEIDKVSYQKN